MSPQLAPLTFLRILFVTSTLLLFHHVLTPDLNIYLSRFLNKIFEKKNMIKYINTINGITIDYC